jgi:hypothetical protein
VAVVQVASEFLAFFGVRDAERQVRAVLLELVEQSDEELGAARVSRVDLYADFASSVDMEGIHRDHWVTRADEIHTYSVARKLSGWTVGLGGAIAARLYNKTLEIDAKSHKYFFHELWSAAGWIPTDEVWRLEFELKRGALAHFGIDSLEDLERSAGSLWRYLTSEWIRLTVPNVEDQTRARWPNHPLWTDIEMVEWQGNEQLRIREMQRNRAPNDKWYLQHGVSLLASYMAREWISDSAEGWRRLGAFLEHLVSASPVRFGISFGDYVLEKVRFKARQYNTGEIKQREPGEDVEEAAREYLRRTGKGG